MFFFRINTRVHLAFSACFIHTVLYIRVHYIPKYTHTHIIAIGMSGETLTHETMHRMMRLETTPDNTVLLELQLREQLHVEQATRRTLLKTIIRQKRHHLKSARSLVK